jgi:UDP-glucose 4-epimerase
MRVFITGGSGFIGSHLADFYLTNGHEVIVLDNYSTGSSKNIEHLQRKIEIHQGDIRNQDLVDELTESADIVLHMAAALGVDTILDSPIESMSVNIRGSETVLNSSLKFNKRVVIASTSEIYGKNPKQPLHETDDRIVGSPQKIRWTYSDAKAIEEAMAYALHKQKGLNVTTLRFFNTVGPRQTGRYGMVIPRFVRSALNGQPLEVYGDGTQSRVFCHVYDVVRAVSAAVENEITIGDVYNVGGEGEISIHELATEIIKITNSTSDVTFTPYESAYSSGFEDIQRRVPSIEKIQSHLGWRPTKSLTQIIEDVANHERVRQS